MFLLIVISFLMVNNFWSFNFAIAFVYILLNVFGRLKSLKGKLFSSWIRQLEH